MFDTNRAPILHQDYVRKDQNKLPLEPRHLLVRSGVSKMISEPMVCSAQNVHLSCTDTNTVSKRNKAYGTFKMIYEPMVRSTQTVHLSCVKISIISECSELSIEHHHLVAPSSASKMISEPMVCLAQTVHLFAPTLTMSPKRKK